MTIIGLTGGIGSGKSIVSEIFRKLDIYVFDSDAESKSIMNTNEYIVSRIKKKFGEELYENGLLNRKKLSEIIFYRPEAIEFINALVHPVVIVEFENRISRTKSAYFIIESAILFESDAYKQVDKIICVTAPEKVRIERVMKRDHVTYEHVKVRLNNQMKEEEKIKRSDYIIRNNIEPLIPQVLEIHHMLLNGID
jgi:dephospho-CoA kinase